MADDLLTPVMFETIAMELPNFVDETKKAKGVVAFDILKNGKPVAQWTIDLRNPPGEVYEGPPKVRPNCSVTVEDEIFAYIAAGEMDGVKAFLQGKAKVKGDVMLMMKLQNLMKKVTDPYKSKI